MTTGRGPIAVVAVGLAAAVIVALLGLGGLRRDDSALKVADPAELPSGTTLVEGDGPAAGDDGRPADVTTTSTITVGVPPGTLPDGSIDPAAPGVPGGGGGGGGGGAATTTVAGAPGGGGNPAGGGGGGGGGATTTKVVPPTTPPPTVPPTSAATTTTTTAAPACPVLLCEDFADDAVGSTSPIGWSVDTGSWYVVQTGTSHWAKGNSPGVEARLSRGGNWGNYEITARVMFASGAVWGGVAAHYQDANNYYFCKADASAGKLYSGRYRNGVADIVREVSFSPTLGVSHDVRMRWQNGTVTCSMGSATTASFNDSLFATGRVAIISQHQSALTDIRVTAV